MIMSRMLVFRWHVLLPLALLLLTPFSLAQEPTGEIQQIYSWKERVRVYPPDMEFKAKLDSGARTSSINAVNIEEFRRDKEDWVRFTIENWQKERRTVERKIIRHVRIKEHGGTTQRRAVVKLGICLGMLYKEVEVNLVDRSAFTTGMLIGRSFMEDDVLIDPSTTYSHPVQCERQRLDE